MSDVVFPCANCNPVQIKMPAISTTSAPPRMTIIHPRMRLLSDSPDEMASNRLPDRKYPNSSSEAMKLMMFCTYLTSP